MIVFTTFPESEFDAAAVLRWYRLRWEVELVFKRFKSLAGLGHLPKRDSDSARAWPYGKPVFSLAHVRDLERLPRRPAAQSSTTNSGLLSIFQKIRLAHMGNGAACLAVIRRLALNIAQTRRLPLDMIRHIRNHEGGTGFNAVVLGRATRSYRTERTDGDRLGAASLFTTGNLDHHV